MTNMIILQLAQMMLAHIHTHTHFIFWGSSAVLTGTNVSIQVISGLDKSENTEKTIFIACEEDMKDALDASKRGMRVFSSEWLMNCVMKQELDLEASQFAESL
jgi:hypothetical protein